jgi:hypothetical protein
MFVMIRFSPIPTSASGIGYRRNHFLSFKMLLPSPFTYVEGVGFRQYPYVVLVMKQKIPFTNTGEDQRSTTEVFQVIPFHPLISSDVEYRAHQVKCFGC